MAQAWFELADANGSVSQIQPQSDTFHFMSRDAKCAKWPNGKRPASAIKEGQRCIGGFG
jgi:hypothetical protein